MNAYTWPIYIHHVFKITAKQCPDIMEYSDCSSLCPVTCEAQDPVETAKHCPADCVSGCQCPEGTVLEGGRCITADQCPCVHNREKYPPGGTVRSKCNLWSVLAYTFFISHIYMFPPAC